MALPPGASGSAVTGSQINTAPERCKAAFLLSLTLFATPYRIHPSGGGLLSKILHDEAVASCIPRAVSTDDSCRCAILRGIPRGFSIWDADLN